MQIPSVERGTCQRCRDTGPVQLSASLLLGCSATGVGGKVGSGLRHLLVALYPHSGHRCSVWPAPKNVSASRSSRRGRLVRSSAVGAYSWASFPAREGEGRGRCRAGRGSHSFSRSLIPGCALRASAQSALGAAQHAARRPEGRAGAGRTRGRTLNRQTFRGRRAPRQDRTQKRAADRAWWNLAALRRLGSCAGVYRPPHPK